MKRYVGAVVAALLGVVSATTAAHAAERTVVVVMFDGFAPASLDAAGHTPNFDRMRREGLSSRHLVPAFPTVSSINHATFETGCWPAHHGIMGNIFVDPKRGRFEGSPDADWRTGCEEMWTAAERQGVHAAVFNFDGRWSATRGKLATFINPPVPWQKRESDETILKRAIALLHDNGPDHPRLIALYFDIPDSVAHWNGTTAAKTEEAVRRCDAIAGRLMAALASLPPGREGTLVVGTDHGMMDVGPLINIGRLMNMYDINGQQASDGTSAFLYLDKTESIDRVRRALSQYGYAFDVYAKGHYPAYAHLGNSARAGDLLLVGKPPYWIVGPEAFPPWSKWLGVTHIWPVTFVPPVGGLKATHGYPPDVTQMHGIFFAWGAGVAQGQKLARLDMIDIHPTVMTLLGLQPGNPVDGHAIEGVSAPAP